MSWRDQITYDHAGKLICEGACVSPIPAPGAQFDPKRNPLRQRWPVVKVDEKDGKKRIHVISDAVAARMFSLYGDESNKAWHDPGISDGIELSPVNPEHVRVHADGEDADPAALIEEVKGTFDEAEALIGSEATSKKDRNLLVVNYYGCLREMLALLQSEKAIADHPHDPAAAEAQYRREQKKENF